MLDPAATHARQANQRDHAGGTSSRSAPAAPCSTVGARAAAAGTRGPSGQYVNVPFSPRYHQVITCAIFTRCSVNDPKQPHHILQPHRRGLDANAPRQNGVKVSVQPTVVQPTEVEQHQHGGTSRAPQILASQLLKLSCCSSSRRSLENKQSTIPEDSTEMMQ